MLIYPRLPVHAARSLIGEYEECSLEELRERSSLEHPLAAHVPTGGVRCGIRVLDELRATIRELSSELGWPGSLDKADFDYRVARQLRESMCIVPADAAQPGVWAFLACVVLPDIACWRFTSRTHERLFGGPRNVFRRLWWRAHLLGGAASGPDPLRELGEDELVQIMERPVLSGNPRIARQICASFRKAREDQATVPRMHLMREGVKRLNRLPPIVSLGSLSNAQLSDTVDAAFHEAAHCLAARSDGQGI